MIETDDNKDSDRLGAALARACAGFLNQWLHTAGYERRRARIGVTWGFLMKQVLNELEEHKVVLEKPAKLPDVLIWSPIIGIITAEMTDREAGMIADGFRTFYGGQLERFGCAGFALADAKMPTDVAEVIANLENADLVLTSGSPWDPEAYLAQNTALDRSRLPDFSEAVGTISGVFLDATGKEVRGQYSIVGLGYEGLRKVAQNGEVVLICGGDERSLVVLAALRARLVSVLVTTRQTAEWMLQTADGPGSVPRC